MSAATDAQVPTHRSGEPRTFGPGLRRLDGGLAGPPKPEPVRG